VPGSHGRKKEDRRNEEKNEIRTGKAKRITQRDLVPPKRETALAREGHPHPLEEKKRCPFNRKADRNLSTRGYPSVETIAQAERPSRKNFGTEAAGETFNLPRRPEWFGFFLTQRQEDSRVFRRGISRATKDSARAKPGS